MKTSAGNLLPYFNSTYFTVAQLAAINASVGGMADDTGVPKNILFATGDTRGNENLELTSLETLFVRNHNMLAGKLQKEHTNWTDGQVYQEARKINIAGYQAMIYNQYLPALLGATALPKFNGYKSNVNAGISNEFSTVAFRMGHSMVSPDIARDGNDGTAVAAEVPLEFDFFDPNLLSANGAIDPYTGLVSTDIAPVLKSMADGNGQAMDNLCVDEIRNLLFGSAGSGGEDLIARDIQRGRDNGIADYNSLRVSMGLKAVTGFADITSNKGVQAELAAAYPGGVGTVDAFEGGMDEDHVAGSDVGPLFQRILVDQFTRLRDGDRYYYQSESMNADEMNLFQQVNTLTKVIEANSTVTRLQANAFVYTNSLSGSVTTAPNGAPPPRNAPAPRPVGIAGIVVSLLDSDGDIVATTTTNAAGHYTFNQQDGLATGSYTVSIALMGGATLITPKSIVFTAGDQNADGINFNVQPAIPPVISHIPRI